MSRTIAVSGTVGVTLATRSDAPLRVLAGVTVASAGDYGVLGIGAYPFRVSNLGSLSGLTAGVDLHHGGTVASGSGRAPGATISGGRYGVFIDGGAGLVRNFGTVSSVSTGRTSYPLNAYGYLSTSGVGVELGAGGDVFNGGIFGRQGLIEGGAYGVRVLGGTALVSNNDTIVGRGAYGKYGDSYSATGFSGVGVSFGQGILRNGSYAVASATIIGGDVGASLGGGGRYSAYLENYGTIIANASLTKVTSRGGTGVIAGGIGVSIASSGHVNQFAGATIVGAEDGVVIQGGGGVVNYGMISGLGESTSVAKGVSLASYSGVGVLLGSGGGLLNGAGADAVIEGGLVGVLVEGGPGYLTNRGRIAASGVDRTVRNASTTGSAVGVGVKMTEGGTVLNNAPGAGTASITGSLTGVDVSGGPALVANYGLISGDQGVLIGAGVSSATVANYGTIVGTAGIALSFASGDDTVVLQPGATFVGAVVASAGGANTLVLGNHGATPAALDGFGAQFRNFGTLAVAAGASWYLLGTNTAADLSLAIAAGASLDVLGSLAVTGTAPTLRLQSGTFAVAAAGTVTVGDGPASAPGVLAINAGSVIANGTIAAAILDNSYLVAQGSLLVTGQLVGAGQADIAARSVLELGAATSLDRINFAGVGGTLVVDQPSSFSGQIVQFNQTELIDFSRQVVSAVSFSSATYRLAVFDGATQIASLRMVGNFYGDTFGIMADGHGGTNVVLR